MWFWNSWYYWHYKIILFYYHDTRVLQIFKNDGWACLWDQWINWIVISKVEHKLFRDFKRFKTPVHGVPVDDGVDVHDVRDVVDGCDDVDGDASHHHCCDVQSLAF